MEQRATFGSRKSYDEMSEKPPALKALHSAELLVATKLDAFRNVSTENLIASLRPDQSGSLKTRPDGTMIDGHRIAVLRERGIDVDSLPREIIIKD